MCSVVLPRLSLKLHEISKNNVLVLKNVEFSLKKSLKIKFCASIYGIFAMIKCLNDSFDVFAVEKKFVISIFRILHYRHFSKYGTIL